MIGQLLKRSLTTTTATTAHYTTTNQQYLIRTTTSSASACCLREFHSSHASNGKTDGNNPVPTPKPYELARRKKIALAKKQGRDLFAEQEAQRTIVQFPNKYISLWVPSVLKPTKQVTFHVPMDITKPELKEILTNYYDLKVVKVNTLINVKRGKQARQGRGQVIHGVKSKQYKKAVAYLEEEVDVALDDSVKKTIESFYDRSKLKQYKEEALKEKMRSAQQKQEEFVNQQEEPTSSPASATQSTEPAQLEAK